MPNFDGIVEMDETYFLYSEKGQRKLKIKSHASVVVLQRNMV